MEPFPAVPRDGESDHLELDTTRARSNSTKTQSPSSASHSPSSASPRHTHKRSLSGSVFAKLPFLRTPASDKNSGGASPKSPSASPKPDEKLDEIEERERSDGSASSSPKSASPSGGAPKNNMLASVIAAQAATRRRKSSLRKTALLGTGSVDKLRHPPNESSKRPALTSPKKSSIKATFDIGFSSRSDVSTSPELSRENTAIDLTPDHGNTDAQSQMTKHTISTDLSQHDLAMSPTSNTTSPLSPDALAAPPSISTTDDDDVYGGITLHAPSLLNYSANQPRHPPIKSPSISPSPPSSESSGPRATSLNPSSVGNTISSSAAQAAAESLLRRRSTPKSPLSTASLNSLTASPSHDPTLEWDYSETEWWGWVILIVTWFVFVVGMGSCFEVWSWAWDVGQTPYAPPEFEDDDSLPIVGYYPALLVLTCVMGWVWCVVSWVGMKYFRHAKISVDGGTEGAGDTDS